MAENELFQYSVVSALMDGVAERGLPIAKLIAHGNHGLGTFKHMVGEMIVLDGSVYQMKSDGTVTAVDASPESDVVSPFAMVTRFQPTATTSSTLLSKQHLTELLSKLLPDTRNHYVAFRLDGVFANVTVRTVGGQSAPHEGLADVGRNQTSHTFADVSGTVIGFRAPAYMQGISVAGDHLHFITADRRRGGHMLACESKGPVTIAAAPISRVHLELPSGDVDFNEARLKTNSDGIAAVEG